ncbi:MAG: glycosyltransferase [Planctomycetes bacterium]|nr:glycosyltransferase [Planctomycetota bacterium]
MAALHVAHVMEATIGGTRRHLRDVARLQRALGLDVTVIASNLREPRVEADFVELERLGVVVERLPMRRAIAPFADLGHERALERILAARRPDVVHSHSSKAGVLARLASLSTGIGVRVHTPHTFAFLFEALFSAPKRAFFRRIEAALAERTHAVVAVSRGDAETIAASRVVPAERLRVVENGIDPAPWLAARPIGRATLGVPEKAPLALVAGLLNAAKGQDLALELLALPAGRELVLLLAGDGADRARLEARARALGVAERVRFLGWRDDVPSLMAACDLVLLPSRWEGLPYVVLEALAAGVPVVATPVDGARELVLDGTTGVLARAITADALDEALGRFLALTAPRRAELGRNGRERVLAGYTAERMAARLAALYRELV